MKLFSPIKVRSGLLGTLALSVIVSLALVAVVAMSPGMAIAQNQDIANQSGRSDAVIESDVTAALNSSAVLKAQPITAATIEGNVTLSGHVSDAASRELAGMLAMRVPGVNAVNNNLTVGGQPAPDTGVQAAANDGEQPPPALGNPPNASQDNRGNGPQYGSPQNEAQDMQQNGGSAPMGASPAPMPGVPPAANEPRAPYAPQNQYPQNRAPEQASGPVQIPHGTLLKVRLSELLDARRAQQGTMFEATAANDIYSDGVLAIPRGATLEGQVVDVRNPKGSLGGSESLTLKLNSLVLGGKTYTLDTDVWSSHGPGKAGYTAGNTVTGAALGAIIGGIAGGGMGAGIGAAAGGATGAVGSAATTGPRLVLPPELVLTFHLATAITVQPVSQQEAQRLATASQRGPALQQRPAYPPYGYYPGYPPPPIAYGYPYDYYPRYRGYYYGGYFGR